MRTSERSEISIALPSVSVGFNYVLILEWLDVDDVKTGELLQSSLSGMGIPAKLVVCNSADDVRQALKDAAGRILRDGRPAVHIEAHGASPEETGLQQLAFGGSSGPGLLWSDLGEWLAPINEACDFKLMTVGAACFGFAAIAAMKLNAHHAPFAACIGFTTSVTHSSIRDSCKELYRSIAAGDDLSAAIASAKRELKANEAIQATTSIRLAIQVLREVFDNIRTERATERWADALIEKAERSGGPIPPDGRTLLPELLRGRTRTRIEDAWYCWFPQQLGESDPAYRLDWKLVEAALR